MNFEIFCKLENKFRVGLVQQLDNDFDYQLSWTLEIHLIDVLNVELKNQLWWQLGNQLRGKLREEF